MKKKIILFLLTFCTLYLQARQIILIKSDSTANINQLTYLAYKTKNGNTIIDFAGEKKINFNNKNAVSFTVKNTDTDLALMLYNADKTNRTAYGYTAVNPGENPLTYILHYYKNSKLLILEPVI